MKWNIILLFVIMILLVLVITLKGKEEYDSQLVYPPDMNPTKFVTKTPAGPTDCSGNKRDYILADARDVCTKKFGALNTITDSGCDGTVNDAGREDTQQCGYCPRYYCVYSPDYTKICQSKCDFKDPDLISFCAAANGDTTKCNQQASSNLLNCRNNCGVVGPNFDSCMKNNGDFSHCVQQVDPYVYCKAKCQVKTNNELINSCATSNKDLTKCSYQASSNLLNCTQNCGPVGPKFNACMQNNGDFSHCT